MIREFARVHRGGTCMVVRFKTHQEEDKSTLAYFEDIGDGSLRVKKGGKVPGLIFLSTGFLCHANGYVLTCAHSIQPTYNLGILLRPQYSSSFQPQHPYDDFVSIQSGATRVLMARLCQIDTKNDVALIKIDGSVAATLPDEVFSRIDMQVGDDAFFIGYPFADLGNHIQSISSCIVSAKVINDRGTHIYQVDGVANKGNSGGPLINSKTGQIAGIIIGRFNLSYRYADADVAPNNNICYASHVKYGLALLAEEGLNE